MIPPIYSAGRLWAMIDTGEQAQRRAWLGASNEMAPYYREQAESLRPGTYAHLHLNAWQSGEEAFLTADDWDACVDSALSPLTPARFDSASRAFALSVGIDAATKQDSAAVVAVAHDGERIRLCAHRIWTPTRHEPLDLEETVEDFLLQLKRDYFVRSVRFDPFQMARSATTLGREGLPMVEFPQTSGNLTAAGQALYDLVRQRRLAVYPDEELRRHVLNAVAVETARGWRLAKERASRKIDAAMALSFAVLDVIERPGCGTGNASVGWIDGHAGARLAPIKCAGVETTPLGYGAKL